MDIHASSLRRRARLPLFIAAAALIALCLPTAKSDAASGSLTFSKPLRLTPWSGGEPSIAFDSDGLSVYVTAPQYIPSASNALLTGFLDTSKVRPGDVGVGFWASTDGGHTFPMNKNIGSGIGGGDSDVIVDKDHRVYVADLEAVATAICTSTDRGKSFTSGAVPGLNTCSNLVGNQQGPEDDREWLTPAPNGTIYLTYHDFTFGFPIILSSTDHAQTFTPCGTILNPSGPAGQNYNPLNGTLVAKPVIGHDGSIYVTVTEPDQLGKPVGASLNHVFVGVARGGCSPTAVFDNYNVYNDPGAAFTLFNSLGIDGGDVLYAVAAGKTKAGQATQGVWLFSSHDHGKTWSAPIRVNSPNLTSNAMPAVVGGLGTNQVAVGWFGTPTSGDSNNGKNRWDYYVATSFDGGKTFKQTLVSKFVHNGDICTDGTLCGLPTFGSNRNLADFSSITVNPKSGCVVVAFPGDPWNRPDINGNNDGFSSAFVALQKTGPCLAKAASVTSVKGITRTRAAQTPARTLPQTGVGNHVALAIVLMVSAAIVARRVSLDR